MEKVYILADGEIVTAMQLSAEPLEGWIETSATAIPDTTSLDGCTVEVVWDGKTLSVVQVPIPPPTRAEVEAERQEAYKQRVYPLVCEIMIYKDKLDELAETPAPIGQENAFAAKVAELRANIAQVRTARDEAIEAINAEYPYTVES